MSKSHDKTSIEGRSAATEAAYVNRFRQIEAQALRHITAPPTATKIAAFVVDEQRPALAPASWRVYRASASFGLSQFYAENTADLEAALVRLNSAKAEKNAPREPKTSAIKSKRFENGDISRICNAALTTRSAYAEPLVLYLKAGDVCGLRPIEWIDVVFRRATEPAYQWEMIVKNAKHDVLRAHGPTRTLRWIELSESTANAIRQWIDIAAAAAGDGSYESLIGNLRRLMYDLTRRLFPKRAFYPSLYTPRHECTARWKAHYIRRGMTTEERLQGLAKVAALLGHASDATATEHYGRPRRGDRLTAPVPHPDPAEVSRIRQKLDLSYLDENTRDLGTRTP
jgi:integrase